MSRSLALRSPIENNLLAALRSKEYEHLHPHLESVSLPNGKVLYDCGEPIRYVYFPTNSIIFMLATMEDGTTTEVGVIGFEGMLGVSVISGDNLIPNQAVTQIASRAVRMRAGALKEEFDRGGQLQSLLLRYMQALFIQVSQSAVCNRVHHMEVRLCRWLLMMHDRLTSDDLPLTQEFAANMLGTQRPYVTAAAGTLQKEGLIRCQRGHITILNRQGLEACACECYRVVQNEFVRLLGEVNAPGNRCRVSDALPDQEVAGDVRPGATVAKRWRRDESFKRARSFNNERTAFSTTGQAVD